MRKNIIINLVFHCNVEDKRFEELTQGELLNGLTRRLDQLTSNWDSSAFSFVNAYEAPEMMSAVEIAGKYPHGYPAFPPDDWKYDVANGNTKLGYYDWAAHMIESTIDDDTETEVYRGSLTVKLATTGKWLIANKGAILATGYATKELAMAFADGWHAGH